jgi:hypothetical protein
MSNPIKTFAFVLAEQTVTFEAPGQYARHNH